ncbi:MAG: Two-component response regulator [Bacteriovoracaceae bacterium]|nr:Two-component response regulator [Bacteriovoracaceae bacterium]
MGNSSLMNQDQNLNSSTVSGESRERMQNPKSKFKGRILLLEDDELLGAGISKQLLGYGIECLWVSSFEKAKEALGNMKIHGIVTDICLKGQAETGLDLISKAGSLGLPIIVITSNANLNVAKQAMNDGASYLLEKPFEVKTLAEVLNKLWMEPKNHIGIIERFFELNELTAKEKEITRLLLKGLSNAEIASTLKISDKTVKFHLTTIFGKCGVESRTELYSTIIPT